MQKQNVPPVAVPGDDDGEEEEEYEEVEVEEEVEEVEEEVEEVHEEDVAEEEKLKFIRYKTNILESDHATNICVHDRFIVIGTERGIVYALDFEGNTIKKIHEHSHEPVHDIAVDECGEAVGSCSMSGAVIISGVYSDSRTKKNFDRPITAIALHPMYSKRENAPWVCGGHDSIVRLMSKGRFFKTQDERILHQGEGRIHALSWQGDNIAWANDNYIVVYDVVTFTMIFKQRKPDDASTPHRHLYRASVTWQADRSLLVAWGGWVISVAIKPHRNDESSKYGEILYDFCVKGYSLCGVAPFDENLLLLSYESDLKVKEKAPTVVRIFTRFKDVIASYEVKTIDYTRVLPLQYFLAYNTLLSEKVYYIMSPEDIIVVRPSDIDDHIAWLLKHAKYAEALKCAKESRPLRNEHSVESVGDVYMRWLVSNGKADVAAGLLEDILGVADDDKTCKLWEYWAAKLARMDHQTNCVLIAHLPKTVAGKLNGPRLGSTVYEFVLNHFIVHQPKIFKQYIQEFKGLYDYAALTKQAKLQVQQWRLTAPARLEFRDDLGEALGLLFEYQKMYTEAMDQFMGVRGSEEIFDFVRRHNLLRDVVATDKLEKLFSHNTKNAVKFLIENINFGATDEEEKGPLHPDNVIGRLGSYNQFVYLHELFLTPKSSRYLENHYNVLALRYVEHDPRLLLNFLRNTTSISKLNLKDIWKKIRDDDSFVDEEVYLRERMGFRDEALDLIVRKMRSIKRAVQFCTRNDDNGELFNKLINMVLEQSKDRSSDHVEVRIKANTSVEALVDLYDVTEADIKKYNGHVDFDKLKDPKRVAELTGVTIRIRIDMLSDLLKYVAEPPEDGESRPASSFLDAKLLLMRIPEDRHIPQIGEKLSKIVKGSQVQATLLEALNKVLMRDVMSLQNIFDNNTRRAIEIDMVSHCQACNRKLTDLERDQDVVVFGCGHVFHCSCYMGVLRRWQEKGHLPADLFVPTLKTVKGKSQENPMLVFTRPEMFAKPSALDAFPSCVRCEVVRVNARGQGFGGK